jgi:glyoxylase-like metal-dependent hydrolase (beta-lactamase superfamily II)
MGNKSLPNYEVYAIRYAWVGRRRQDNFIVHDAHEGDMPMDYFVWLVRNQDRTILIDTGFNQEAARLRKRNFIQCPIQALSGLGVRADEVSDVIITHLHYDHAGNLRLLPNSRIHVQEREIQFATGRYMQYDMLRHAYTVDDVVDVVRGVYDKRVVFYDGDAEPFPGIQLVLIGGHTMGLQSVRVHTERGWLVLASDASHYYENFMKDSPFPILFDMGAMLRGFDILRSLVTDSADIIPGHDPEVMRRYPPLDTEHPDVVVLHGGPR